jgi:hypothetical protein
MTSISKVETALDYAAHGWKVFPIRPDGKEPCTPHGVDDATTDESMIMRWFGNGLPNIGIATGVGSIDVLDVDVHPTGNGYAALRVLAKAGLVKGAQAIVRTPSGGAHLWFKGTDQRNGRLKDHHIDFRSQGGYVLVPPSVVAGKPYVLSEQSDDDGTCDWSAIRALLEPPISDRSYNGPHDPLRLGVWVSQLNPGERNTGLYWAACRAAEIGLDLEPLIIAAVTTGLSERDARATVTSAVRSVLRDAR